MIGRANDNAIGRVTFLHKLKERIQNASHFGYVIRGRSLTADRIKLVEQVNTAALGSLIKNKAQLRGRLTHITRYHPFKADNEQRKVKLTRQSLGRHRLP